MTRPESEHPTELELEILKVLWDESPLLVRDVRRRLEDRAGRVLAHRSSLWLGLEGVAATCAYHGGRYAGRG